MRKLLMVSMLVMVMVAISIPCVAAPVDRDQYQQHLDQNEYTVVVTAGPIDEVVLKNMDSQGWTFLTVVKYKKKHYWYFVKPAELWLNQQ